MGFSLFFIFAKIALPIMRKEVTIMLFGIIGLTILVYCLEKFDRLERENENRKAIEDGYEVYFSR